MNKYIPLAFSFLLPLSSCSDADDLREEADLAVKEMAGIRSFSDETLDANGTKMSVSGEDGHLSAIFSMGGKRYLPIDKNNVVIEVFKRGTDESKTYQSEYTTIEKVDESLKCTALITTDGGSEFETTDIYSRNTENGSIRMNRTVKVKKVAAVDYSFNSYYLLGEENGQSKTSYEYFLPSLIYKDNTNMTDASIGADLTDSWILAREERTALPLTMMRNKATGNTISITDYNLNPATTSADWGMSHLVDSRMKYGSIGYCMTGSTPQLAYCYPGSEGEHSYSDGGGTADKRWARRSHPVMANTQHTYTLDIYTSHTKDFPEALQTHWQKAFNLYDPAVLSANSNAVMRYSINQLNTYWMSDNGAPGFPFSVECASGAVKERSYSMGFVGMQIPCGYYLYRRGLENDNTSNRQKGEQVIDFWTTRSLIASGMPRIWWDISPWNTFRNYNDLRNMQGGLEAVIDAWSVAEKHKQGSKASWLSYCRRAADWLISQQAADGSIAKAYDNTGNVVDNGKYLTSNIIRFFCQMYAVTCDTKYRDAAIKAGEFCYKEIHTAYKYIGSVIDNPYVKDRESGQKMLEACLALYDMTHERKWLDAAVQAAYYTVTYMYAWNIPAEDGWKAPWTSEKNTAGITIIATGHSGADCGLSYNSFEYFRLHLLTGDEYLLKIAKLLQYNTKQTMNFDGKLGYATRGMQTEALRLVTHRGDGVNLWLPWVTATALDPMFRLQDAYGNIDIKNLEQKSKDELLALDRIYAETQGVQPTYKNQ